MPLTYDLTLGSLSFITLNNTVTETFGNVLTNVGSGTVPAEREPYRYENLTVPVYGHMLEADPYEKGLQLRREARAMFRNRQLLTDGFYMDFAMDPELSAWIAVGNASLQYLDGGVSLADFQLNLGQVQLIATPAIALQGVQVNSHDLGQTTTPNDILQTSFNSLTQGSFALGGEGVPRVNLGVGASDIQQRSPYPGTLGTYSGLNGTGYYIDGLSHGSSVAFEIAPANRRGADVLALDRRGVTSPTYTLAGDRNPNLYGWDKIFGPDYPHTATDVPVLQNDRTRIMFNSGTTFQIQTSTGSAFANNGTLNLGMDSITNRAMIEWRPYRSVVRINMVGGGGNIRAVAFIILQRGWAGPQVELYAQNVTGAPASATITYSGSLTVHTNESDRWQMIRLGAVNSEITWKTVSQDVVIAR